MAYDNPMYQTLVAHANAAVSTAADIFQFTSPVPGKAGRVVGVSIVTTTATTVAASAIRIGTVADPDAYGEITIPVTAIDTAIPVTAAQLTAMENLPADTVLLISGSGGATAGAVDLAVTIAWD